jgi:lysozyme
MKFKNYDLIKRWEGLELEAYKDGGGVWTIGYGHTGAAGDPKPSLGMKITLEQAKAILDKDLVQFEKAVNDSVKVPLTQNQYDALVSLAYNIGPSGFKGSTVLRRLNDGNYDGAAEAITWWNKDNGKVIKGLVNRRAAERELFLTPDQTGGQLDLRNILTEELMREYTQKLIEIWRK